MASSIQRVSNPLSGSPPKEKGRLRFAAAAALFLVASLGFFYVRSAARALLGAPPPPEQTHRAAAEVRAADGEEPRRAAGAMRGGGAPPAAGGEVLSDREAEGGNEPAGDSTGGDFPRGVAATSDGRSEAKDDDGSIVALDTPRGQIRIRLRPDLSPESVDYIRQMLSSSAPCGRCNLYRAEKPGILQGVLSKEGVPHNSVLGNCPPEYLTADGKPPPRQCPPHDPNCGCHGPIMTRGMVAWAGGGGGPDFFFDMYQRPAKWWGNDHTVWGELADEKSTKLVDEIFELPATDKGGMTFLDERIQIDLVAAGW